MKKPIDVEVLKDQSLGRCSLFDSMSDTDRRTVLEDMAYRQRPEIAASRPGWRTADNQQARDTRKAILDSCYQDYNTALAEAFRTARRKKI